MQLKFQSSFALLKQAAAGGQGMSSFSFLHNTRNEQEDFYQEEYDAGDSRQNEEHDGDNEFKDDEYGETAQAEGPRSEFNGQYQEHYEHPAEHGEAGYEEYYQEGEYQEQTGEEEFYIPEQDEAAARLDELEADRAYEGETDCYAPENQETAADESYVAGQQVVTAASSATAQGDSVNTSAGEYDDELIDWDYDSLTTTLSEHDADAHQEISTFLTEYEDEDAKGDAKENYGTEPQENPGLTGNIASGLLADDSLASARPQKPTDQEHGDEARTDENSHEAGEQEGNYTFEQADTYDEQHEEYHPEYQPGEEDDQFHTAHDFLNTDHYEHGLEHDVYGGDENGLDDTVGTVIHHEVAEHQDYDDEEDFDDDIGLDEDDGGDQQKDDSTAISDSLTGKRSFDELDEFDDEGSREAKKARAS